MKTENLAKLLEVCIGTGHHYYCPPFSTKYTDGVKLFAEKAEAYWFLSDLLILIREKQWFKNHFLNIVLKVSDKQADLVVDDGNDVLLYTKHYDYTDCPEGEWQFFYLSDVLMLPSEY